jgi:hypothetical protein
MGLGGSLALPVGGDGIRNGGAEDGAQRELRPTGRARLLPSRDSSVFNPWLRRDQSWLIFIR